MDVSCDDAMIFMKDYFAGSVATPMKDRLLAHIIECKECRKAYREWASEIGQSFNIAKHVKQIKMDIQANYVNLECRSYKAYEEHRKKVPAVAKINLSFADAARKEDYATIMNCKAIRDFVREDFDVQPGQEVVYRRFGVFMTIKIAEKIDYLEKCLRGD